LWGSAQRRQLQARTVTLKVKYADFRQITRARTLSAPVPSEEVLLETGQNLMAPLFPFVPGVRLLGLTLSGFHAAESAPCNQMELLF
ncbi:MAG: DNA polymerase IV, partial [Gluconobacter oxydans]